VTDLLTVIRGAGRRLTKLHAPGGTIGYDDAWLVSSHEELLDGLGDLARVIGLLASNPECAVIRGRRRDDARDAELVWRAKYAAPAYGQHAAPGFEPAPRRWLCVDIDDLPAAWDPGPGCRAELAAWARSQLPDWLARTSCYYQWSASAGVAGWSTVKIHLWWWLDRSVDDESLRAWARSTPRVDPALYESVQLHYTAAPIFEGVPDPLDGEPRSGLIHGERPTAIVPESVWGWSVAEAERRRLAREERSRSLAGVRVVAPDRARAAWVEAALGGARAALLASTPGGRHDALVSVAGSLANLVSWGWVADETARATLECSPIADAPGRDGEIDRAWDHALERAGASPAPEPLLGGRLRRELATARGVEPAALRKAAGRALCVEVLRDPGLREELVDVARHGGAPYLALQSEIEDLGVAKRDVARVVAAIREEVARDAPAVDEESTPLPDEWSGGPYPDGSVLPPGYAWDGARLVREIVRQLATGEISVRRLLVAPCPLVAVGRARDVECGGESTSIAWRRDGRWATETVPRGTLAAARLIVGLADRGLPVTSTTAAAVVDYLAAAEASNAGALAVAEVSARLGWHSGARYLWGAERAAEGLAYRAADSGDAQIARSLRAGGTMAGWVALAEALDPYPLAAAALYASVAAALLHPLGAHNFAVDWSFSTSSGKTTALLAAASVWGAPELVAGWDQTRVGAERRAALLCDAPLILDDTKRAKDRRAVAQAVYDVVGGVGRGRGSIGGLAATSTWRTVLLSSGEEPLTSHSEDGGTRARVISLWGQVFGSHGEAQRLLAQRTELAAATHYGHAGPAVVAALGGDPDGWSDLRSRHVAVRSTWGERAGGDAVRGRLAEHVATLQVAGELLVAVTGAQLDVAAHMEALWGCVAAGAVDADRAGAALAHVVSWANAHRATFAAGPVLGPVEPSRGWSGRWDAEVLALYPHVLAEVLTSGGYAVDATVRLWQDRGWTKATRGREPYLQIRIGPDRPRAIAVLVTALEGQGLSDADDGCSPF